MQKPLFVPILTALAAALACAQVSYIDGNRLLRQCEPGTSEDRSRLSSDQVGDFVFCTGYLAGAMDANNTLLNSLQAQKGSQLRPMYCLPKDGIEVGQAVRVTVKWLKNHPEKLHLQGDILIWQSLMDAFPCK